RWRSAARAAPRSLPFSAPRRGPRRLQRPVSAHLAHDVRTIYSAPVLYWQAGRSEETGQLRRGSPRRFRPQPGGLRPPLPCGREERGKSYEVPTMPGSRCCRCIRRTVLDSFQPWLALPHVSLALHFEPTDPVSLIPVKLGATDLPVRQANRSDTLHLAPPTSSVTLSQSG